MSETIIQKNHQNVHEIIHTNYDDDQVAAHLARRIPLPLLDRRRGGGHRKKKEGCNFLGGGDE